MQVGQLQLVKEQQTFPEAPLVSVSILSYNHLHFIENAIDSVLMQEVNFPIEIIVGDDNSKDGTQAILKQYEQSYPNVITVIYHPKDYEEVPGRTNNTTNLLNCRGKYIAMLDGDDSWTSSTKLLQQVKILENDSSIAMTCHDVTYTGKSKKEGKKSTDAIDMLNTKQVFNFNDLCKVNFISTSSLMFRNKLLTKFPDWFGEVVLADYFIELMVAQQGNIHFINESMGTYRTHDNSFLNVFGKSKKDKLRRLNDHKILKELFYPANLASNIRHHTMTYGIQIGEEYIKNRNTAEFMKLMKLIYHIDKYACYRVMKRLFTKSVLRFKYS